MFDPIQHQCVRKELNIVWKNKENKIESRLYRDDTDQIVLLAPRRRPYATVNYFIEIKLNPTGTEFVTSTAILSPSEQIFTPWMEILLDLDRCKSTTTFPKSMLSIRNRLTPSLSRGTILFPLSPHFFTGPQKQHIGLMPFISSSYQIKNNFLFRSVYSPWYRLLFVWTYAVSRSDHISDRYGYISPSTQVIEMILDNPNKSTKARIFH